MTLRNEHQRPGLESLPKELTKMNLQNFRKAGVRYFVHSFISDGFIVWKVMCGTRRGSNPPKPHYYHLFIQSVHSPDILFFLLKFCLYIRGVLVAYPIELSSLVEGT